MQAAPPTTCFLHLSAGFVITEEAPPGRHLHDCRNVHIVGGAAVLCGQGVGWSCVGVCQDMQRSASCSARPSLSM